MAARAPLARRLAVPVTRADAAYVGRVLEEPQRAAVGPQAVSAPKSAIPVTPRAASTAPQSSAKGRKASAHAAVHIDGAPSPHVTPVVQQASLTADIRSCTVATVQLATRSRGLCPGIVGADSSSNSVALGHALRAPVTTMSTVLGWVNRVTKVYRMFCCTRVRARIREKAGFPLL